jgi:hypothetical protein
MAAPAHGPLKEDARSVRIFLLKLGLFVSVWGALYFRGNWIGYGYWEMTWAAVIALGFLVPAPFRPVRRLVIRLGAFIGRSLSLLALAFIYWFGIVPIGLLARMTGKSFMPRGRDDAAETYWEVRPAVPDKDGKASLERQY